MSENRLGMQKEETGESFLWGPQIEKVEGNKKSKGGRVKGEKSPKVVLKCHEK